ncbi:retropepsin-like aspartic protease [Dyadobacter sp. OTU695]|uniref:retropepsin-like aspartic protease n=1 Tax=Dyadobacter sp. OTU695 TaxID=3043860 RepID=UPI00313D41B0
MLSTVRKCITTFLLLYVQLVLAQSELPVVRATSKPVDIRDGNHLKSGYWATMPERKPDYYYPEIPEKPHKVTFITDQDSISFDISYGQEYNFIILVNGKDSCYTRISARYKNPDTYLRKTAGTGPDTIPFTLGNNHKVYVKARLNGSDVKDIQLDLGAGGTIINKTSVKKVKMNFDEQVTLVNSDGVNQVPSASKNLLQIENLVWDSVRIAVANNMNDNEDLLIGNSLFRDKILEINHDQRILVLHDTLPSKTVFYSRHDVVLDGGIIPYVNVKLTTGKKSQSGWAMFDTGARTCILNSTDVPMTYRIIVELAGILGLNETMTPKLAIGKHHLSGFEYKTRDMGEKGLSMILGNDLLKRFNVILDNKNGYLYLQPNSFTNTPYRKRDEYYEVRAVAAMLVLIALAVIFWKSKRGN